MRSVITPKIFIETLVAMLETERGRKAVRLLSQNRAAAIKFKNRYTAENSREIVAVDSFQRHAQTTERFLGQMQTLELDFEQDSLGHEAKGA